MVVVRAHTIVVWSFAESTIGDIGSFYMVYLNLLLVFYFILDTVFLNLECYVVCSFTISYLHYHVPYSFGAAARSGTVFKLHIPTIQNKF